MHGQTFLFVPGNRPERFAKAAQSGADNIIIDWEDAVAAGQKAQARKNAVEFAATHSGCSVWVRTNSARSEYFTDDVCALRSIKNISGVILSKSECIAEVAQLHNQTALPVVADIETAAGMANIAGIAQSQGLTALTYGCLDLANELGVRFGSAGAEILFDRLRSDLVLHSAINRLAAPIETTFPDFRNSAAFAAHLKRRLETGFGSVLCIHPQQIETAKRILTPSENDIAEAAEIVEFSEQSGDAVFQLNGKMVDAPVIEQARNLLFRSGRKMEN